MMKNLEGQLKASGIRFGIVASRFNSFMTEHLVSGAVDAIVRHGGNEKDILLVRVPGSLEIPLTCKKLADSGKVDAIITVGAVIRGSTSHFDLVCNEYAKGVAKVGLDASIPITFGVITADNLEQAIERSGSKAGNKGAEAALAAIEMVNVIKELEN
jgi:6,7-dimethyl-8-ribityllumazine synthase